MTDMKTPLLPADLAQYKNAPLNECNGTLDHKDIILDEYPPELVAFQRLDKFLVVSKPRFFTRDKTQQVFDSDGKLCFLLKEKFAKCSHLGNPYLKVAVLLMDANEKVLCTIDRQAEKSRLSFGLTEQTREVARSTVQIITTSGGEHEVATVVTKLAAKWCSEKLQFEFDPNLGDLSATVLPFDFSCTWRHANNDILHVYSGDGKELGSVRKASRCHSRHLLFDCK